MGSGFKDWAAGDILTAADVDGYLMRQTVMTFADASARDSALSGVLDEGMMAYLEDTNATTYYDGSAWKDVRGIGGGAAVEIPGTFAGGDVLQAAELNALPGGVMGVYSSTAAFATAANHTTLQDTGATLTIDELSGRRYLHVARVNPLANGGVQQMAYWLLRNGSIVSYYTFPTTVLSTTEAFLSTLTFAYEAASDATGVVWKWQLSAITNNTQVQDFATGSYHRQYTIQDIGT